MPTYEVGKTLFIRETGQKYEPGETVDLDEEVASQYIANDPGTLKPMRQTTQARPRVTRQKSIRKPAPKKPRATR